MSADSSGCGHSAFQKEGQPVIYVPGNLNEGMKEAWSLFLYVSVKECETSVSVRLSEGGIAFVSVCLSK